MVKQLDIYKDLNDMIEGILYQGRRISFEIDVKPINEQSMLVQDNQSNQGVFSRFHLRLMWQI